MMVVREVNERILAKLTEDVHLVSLFDMLLVTAVWFSNEKCHVVSAVFFTLTP